MASFLGIDKPMSEIAEETVADKLKKKKKKKEEAEDEELLDAPESSPEDDEIDFITETEDKKPSSPPVGTPKPTGTSSTQQDSKKEAAKAAGLNLLDSTEEEDEPSVDETEAPTKSEIETIRSKIQSLQTQAPEKQEEWNAQKKEALDLMRSNASRAEWLSLASKIGNSLIKYGAAREGLKQGIDMSDIKTEEFDLDKALARYRSDYQDTLASIKSEEDPALKKAAEQKAQAEKALMERLEDLKKLRDRKAQFEHAEKVAKQKQTDKQRQEDDKASQQNIRMVNKTASKIHEDWVMRGDQQVSKNSINTLEGIQEQLVRGEIDSGAMVGVARTIGGEDMNLAKAVYPEATATEQAVAAQVIQTLRQTLGHQFTENEGKRVLALTYDPALSADINAEKLARTIKDLKARYNAKTSAMNHYKDNNFTMQGYDTGDIFSGTLFSEQDKPESRKQKLLRLRAKKKGSKRE